MRSNVFLIGILLFSSTHSIVLTQTNLSNEVRGGNSGRETYTAIPSLPPSPQPIMNTGLGKTLTMPPAPATKSTNLGQPARGTHSSTSISSLVEAERNTCLSNYNSLMSQVQGFHDQISALKNEAAMYKAKVAELEKKLTSRGGLFTSLEECTEAYLALEGQYKLKEKQCDKITIGSSRY